MAEDEKKIRDRTCPFIQLRFEDATLAGSPSDWYCKPKDRVDNYDGNLIETPCNQADHTNCPTYLDSCSSLQEKI